MRNHWVFRIADQECGEHTRNDQQKCYPSVRGAESANVVVRPDPEVTDSQHDGDQPGTEACTTEPAEPSSSKGCIRESIARLNRNLVNAEVNLGPDYAPAAPVALELYYHQEDAIVSPDQHREAEIVGKIEKLGSAGLGPIRISCTLEQSVSSFFRPSLVAGDLPFILLNSLVKWSVIFSVNDLPCYMNQAVCNNLACLYSGEERHAPPILVEYIETDECLLPQACQRY